MPLSVKEVLPLPRPDEEKNEDYSAPSQLVEGVDFYYSPEGYKVFTEHYLLKRGYCCGNRCRHCPYGKKTVG